MSSDEKSPSSPTESDESPKNTIRVIKTKDSDKNTIVEVKVAGESGAKVTIFGGDGTKPPEADDSKNNIGEPVKPLTQEEIDKIVSRYAKMDEKEKRKYLDFFWSVDVYGFGAFTVHQLAYRLRSSWPHMTEKQIAKIFSDLDSNNDMLVTLDEYLEEMSKQKPVKVQITEYMTTIFERTDRNKDGFVCRKDLLDTLNEAGVNITTPELLEFFKKDSSGNAEKLDFQEFCKALQTNRRNLLL